MTPSSLLFFVLLQEGHHGTPAAIFSSPHSLQVVADCITDTLVMPSFSSVIIFFTFSFLLSAQRGRWPYWHLLSDRHDTKQDCFWLEQPNACILSTLIVLFYYSSLFQVPKKSTWQPLWNIFVISVHRW